MIEFRDVTKSFEDEIVLRNISFRIRRGETKPSREFTGNFCIDDLVLYEAGVRDFSGYAAVPGTSRFQPDFFVPANTPPLPAQK